MEAEPSWETDKKTPRKGNLSQAAFWPWWLLPRDGTRLRVSVIAKAP